MSSPPPACLAKRVEDYLGLGFLHFLPELMEPNCPKHIIEARDQILETARDLRAIGALGGSPYSNAAALTYWVCLLADRHEPAWSIAGFFKLKEATVLKHYLRLHEHLEPIDQVLK